MMEIVDGDKCQLNGTEAKVYAILQKLTILKEVTLTPQDSLNTPFRKILNFYGSLWLLEIQ